MSESNEATETWEKCGHPLTPENSYLQMFRGGVKRLRCRTCRNAYQRSYYAEMAKAYRMARAVGRVVEENGSIFVTNTPTFPDDEQGRADEKAYLAQRAKAAGLDEDEVARMLGSSPGGAR